MPHGRFSSHRKQRRRIELRSDKFNLQATASPIAAEHFCLKLAGNRRVSRPQVAGAVTQTDEHNLRDHDLLGAASRKCHEPERIQTLGHRYLLMNLIDETHVATHKGNEIGHRLPPPLTSNPVIDHRRLASSPHQERRRCESHYRED